MLASTILGPLAALATSSPCAFYLPNPAGAAHGCLIFDQLGSLPNSSGAFHLTNAAAAGNTSYFIAGPCGTLPGQPELCPGAGGGAYSGKAAPAVQVYDGDSCLVLGDPAAVTAAPLPAAVAAAALPGGGGISLTFAHGDTYQCGGGSAGRTVRYDMVCDASLPATAPPSATMGCPEGCDYVVTWRTPLACNPTPSSSACPAAPTPPPTPAGPIATPTAAQARYQDTDFIALIHFNMGTYAHNGDPCCDSGNWDVKASYAAGKTSDPATFDPAQLNTTQWMESITGLGANIAILTAKHGCGFTLWPTKSTLPGGAPYGYNVGMAANASFPRDVLREFVDAAGAAGVGYGFYYSIMKSFYLCHSFSGTNSCGEEVLPGQHNFSDAEYADVVRQQVTELWTEYGNLTEIWVDSGLGGFAELMVKLQPQAVGTPANPTSWCGTESGHPSHDVGGADVWSLGGGFHGDPGSPQWMPKFCDPQLFQQHVWFWEPGLAVRTLAMMIPIYHDIVGRGMVMELAFSIDRDGLVEETHAAVYKQLGDWVRSCYGQPVAETTVVASSGGGNTTYELCVPAGAVFDRVQLREDTTVGQRVRSYSVDLVGGDDAGGGGDEGGVVALAAGQAIGTKRIWLLGKNFTGDGQKRLRLTVDRAVAPPVLRQFAAFAPCPDQ